MGHHLLQLRHALGVGGHVRLEVGDVLGRAARGILGAGQQRVRLGLQEAALVDQLEVVDVDALLLDGGGTRRHGAGREPADVLVMPAAGDVEEDGGVGVGAVGVRPCGSDPILRRRLCHGVRPAGSDPARPSRKHRRDHGDVGQVRAAVVGRVQHVDVAGPHLAGVGADHRLDRAVHGAQVHRHVRGVGDELALGVEHRAGEVEPLLDVDRLRRVAQRLAHLLGDRHVEVVEHLQQHGVGRLAEDLALARRGAAQDEIVAWGYLQAPARLHHHGLVRLDDERGAGEAVAGVQVCPQDDGRVVPGAAGVELRPLRLRRRVPSPRFSGERARVRGSQGLYAGACPPPRPCP